MDGAKAAAEAEAELKEQLEVQQSLTQDAQQQVQALRHELNSLQVHGLGSLCEWQLPSNHTTQTASPARFPLDSHGHRSCHAVSGEAEAGGLAQEAVTSEQQARSEAESQLKALQESARLDFERIGALSEQNAELQVCAGAWPLWNTITGSVLDYSCLSMCAVVQGLMWHTLSSKQLQESIHRGLIQHSSDSHVCRTNLRS